MNTNSDDILLLKLIKQGDQIAFRHLFYQYADSLERFITYYIHDREKSQDLVLDIFTYIWENRQNFEIKLTLKAYLFQAARNKSFTYIRDKKIPVYLEEMEGMEIVQNYDSELELQELHHLIEEAVSLLPDKCREIFRKSREENLTNKEIAGQLHISEKTVEGQITIALKKIRIHLGDSYSLNYYSISSNIQFIQDITVDALRLYVCSESILYNFALFIISTTSPFVGTLPLSKYSFKVF